MIETTSNRHVRVAVLSILIMAAWPHTATTQTRPAPAQTQPAATRPAAGHGSMHVPATGEGSASVNIQAAVANPERLEDDRARDEHRRPAEVLAFFGIKPDMRVGEAMAGTGYYTHILSRLVGPRGRVFAQNNRFVLDRFADKPLTALLARAGLENVVRLDRELEDPGFPEGLDAVLLVRFYHDMYWQKVDRVAFNRAVYRSLKPGGVFGIVDHHAAAGSRDRDVETLHRVDVELLKEEIQSAGFVLDAESDVLRRPEDSRDWNIFADNAARRDQTDRFVLRFIRPAR